MALRGETYQNCPEIFYFFLNRNIENTITLQGKKHFRKTLKNRIIKYNFEMLCFGAVFSKLLCFLKCCDFGFVVSWNAVFSEMLGFLKCCCVFYLAVFCTSGPPYFYDPVGEDLSATNLLLSVSHTDYMVIPCYHSLPPHLFERRAHLLPLCNGMSNIFIIKLLTLIYLPSN